MASGLEPHKQLGRGRNMRHIFLGLSAAMMLSACSDPLRDIGRLSDANIAPNAASVAEAPSEARNTGGGLFGRLLNRQPDDPTNAAVEAALSDASAIADDTSVNVAGVSVAAPVAADQPVQRRGLFGLFGGGNRSEPVRPDPIAQNGVEIEVIENATPTQVVQAAVAEPAPEPASRTGLAGLFRRGPAADVPRTGPDAADVERGTVMPFGQIARVCGLRANELGTQVDTAAGYRIYDTIPNSTARRPFYITGFEDNCARTFTGAVVVTGDVQTHEFVRYQGSNERIPYSTVDNAYEALKASVCRVGRGQPCGPRTDRLSRNTQFVTVYDFFGGTFSAVPTKWAQILVHDGQVLAMSVKNGQ